MDTVEEMKALANWCNIKIDYEGEVIGLAINNT